MNKKGFTIIEIVLVIALIGILATISLPVYKKTAAHYSLITAARMIASDIRLAQQRSITESRSYRLLFNTGSDNYQLLSVSNKSEINYIQKGNKIIRTNFTDKTVSYLPSGAHSQGVRVVIENKFGGFVVLLPARKVRIVINPINNQKDLP